MYQTTLTTSSSHRSTACANFHQFVGLLLAYLHTSMAGHTFDLVVSPASSSVCVGIAGTDRCAISDHFAVLLRLGELKTARQREKMYLSENRNPIMSQVSTTISMSITGINSICKSLAAVSLIDDLLDKHSPPNDMAIRERTTTPWYSQAMRHAKILCRKLERKWCRKLERKWCQTKLTIDNERNQPKAIRKNAKPVSYQYR